MLVFAVQMILKGNEVAILLRDVESAERALDTSERQGALGGVERRPGRVWWRGWRWSRGLLRPWRQIRTRWVLRPIQDVVAP